MPEEDTTSVESFETSLKRLEEIVSALEADEIELQDALRKYEEGVKLANMCIAQLRDAEQRVRELVPEEEES